MTTVLHFSFEVNMMLSPKEIVGSNIKRIRQNQGITGSDLARLLLCSQQHVSRIERGLVRLNIEQIQLVADRLNVSISLLLRGV
ncbi:helix-turn-helix domain-containing protein [Providencia sp. Me31A]|uniref:helix-turn-helix domain-containing protein n=1 Tax=Providencia sp. Me31A TaxID=3392637 RepID=UPI003D2E033D